MPIAFILRFAERCNDPMDGAGATGTETVTKVAREQNDADPARTSYCLFPKDQGATGTATSTRIRNEEADADASAVALAIPVRPVMGTSTATAVKMEADDKDPRQHAFTVLPRC